MLQTLKADIEATSRDALAALDIQMLGEVKQDSRQDVYNSARLLLKESYYLRTMDFEKLNNLDAPETSSDIDAMVKMYYALEEHGLLPESTTKPTTEDE